MAEKQYVSQYDSEVKDTYKKITERPAFKYEAASDPAYRAYRDRYQREGKLAMKNSVAEAANLTGGYGNSYAQRLGQQQYGAYLEKLNDALPELYAEAYQRYKAEGEALHQRLNAASGLANAEFGRYKDAGDRAESKEKFAYQKQQDAYKNLADIINSTGYVPTEEELALSGMSAAQAEALSYEFLRRNGLLPEDLAEQDSGGTNYYNLSPTSPFDIGYREGMFGSRESSKLSGN